MGYYTQIHRTDGFGAQFQTILYTLLYTELTNNIYVYSDINHIDLITHTGTIKDTEIENSLEDIVKYMGFDTFCTNRNMITDNVDICDYGTIAYPHINNNINTVFKSKNFDRYKQFFYSDKINRFDKNYLNVAIHIRILGNFENENNRFRDGTHNVPSTYFLDKMDIIRTKYKNKKILFHIYSQGNIEMFKDFIGDDIIFHLNEKVLDTFTDLIFADVLVTTRSSFSYMAALLSNNEIYYLSFWCLPMNNWIICS